MHADLTPVSSTVPPQALPGAVPQQVLFPLTLAGLRIELRAVAGPRRAAPQDDSAESGLQDMLHGDFALDGE